MDRIDLERMLLDKSAEPRPLPLSFFRDITHGFSKDREIGRGRFGVVYKGLLPNGAVVAVRRFSKKIESDINFANVVGYLMKAKHKNIVRFLGYCSERHGEIVTHNGKYIIAEVQERLLCFEYVSKGRLDGYITDASCGLAWRTRYHIIKGICEGIDYLHQNHILHLDIRPYNILLDDNMVAKITDLGMSVFNEEEPISVSNSAVEQLRYLAPEFYAGQSTKRNDIYSLGAVIIELLTGRTTCDNTEKVLENWSNMFGTSESTGLLEQIRVCLQIGIMCMDIDPQKRPVTRNILDRLSQTEISSWPVTDTSSTEQVPTVLKYKILEEITLKFSEERKLGSGGFGTVYKGVFENGKEIAVKKLHNDIQNIDGKQFLNEFEILRRLNHQNIIRLLGYCNETEDKVMEHKGKMVTVEKTNRALCLEYMNKGSLENHIFDEKTGLDWRTRYRIIKGVCQGLEYLHEGLNKPIFHLDLKPHNILLDQHMIPKLADFGLSKLFGEEQTRITQMINGTLGYMAPEYLAGNKVSIKSDIFSLGVIIIKIVAGDAAYCEIYETTSQQFVDSVHGNWRERLQLLLSTESLEVYCQQVKSCLEIALRCVERERCNRPRIGDIITLFNETEIMIDKVSLFASKTKRSIGQIKSGITEATETFDVYPRVLLFPFETNKHVDCQLSLANKADRFVGFWIIPQFPDKYLPSKFFNGVLKPMSTRVVIVTMIELQQQPLNLGTFEVLMVSMGSETELEDLMSFVGKKPKIDNDLLKLVDDLSGEVDWVVLTADVCKPGQMKTPEKHKAAAEYINKLIENYSAMQIICGHAKGSRTEIECDEQDDGYVAATNSTNAGESSATKAAKGGCDDGLISTLGCVGSELAATIVIGGEKSAPRPAPPPGDDIPDNLYETLLSMEGFNEVHIAHYYAFLIEHPNSAKAFMKMGYIGQHTWISRYVTKEFKK